MSMATHAMVIPDALSWKFIIALVNFRIKLLLRGAQATRQSHALQSSVSMAKRGIAASSRAPGTPRNDRFIFVVSLRVMSGR